MPAYIIAQINITDPEKYQEYAKAAGPATQKYGGRFLVRGGAHETLEGDWEPLRLVVIEFPTAAAAREWYESDDYAPLRELRRRASDTDILVVEGV